eukprot:g31981.t1
MRPPSCLSNLVDSLVLHRPPCGFPPCVICFDARSLLETAVPGFFRLDMRSSSQDKSPVELQGYYKGVSDGKKKCSYCRQEGHNQRYCPERPIMKNFKGEYV